MRVIFLIIINIYFCFAKDSNNILEETIQDKFIIQILFFSIVLIALFFYLNLYFKEMNEKELKKQFLLLRQKRFAQMGEMIENIAHQWRQPLSQINSSIMMIDARNKQITNNDKVIKSKIEEIENMTLYMSKVIDDFQNFFNPTKDKENIYLRDFIEKSYQIVKNSFELNKIEFENRVNKKLEINIFTRELEHIIVIFLNNSRDAFILNKVENPKVIVEVLENKKEIILKIKDNAKGIEENLLNKIFELYFSTKEKSQGVGLGLYMAKMLVEEVLNGKINVYNEEDGVVFQINVPKNSEEI